jgi:hypothetical protein
MSSSQGPAHRVCRAAAQFVLNIAFKTCFGVDAAERSFPCHGFTLVTQAMRGNVTWAA